METSTDKQAPDSRVMKKIDNIKGFYMHVAAYVFMNIFIWTAWAIDTKMPLTFWKTSVFMIGVFGGMGLLTHAVLHFGSNLPAVKRWEQKKLDEFMKR